MNVDRMTSRSIQLNSDPSKGFTKQGFCEGIREVLLPEIAEERERTARWNFINRWILGQIENALVALADRLCGARFSSPDPFA